ncbi:MAG: hypothetical protein HQM10_21635 [Candidatus Riflebacteria bacterium]|nr:hypothetical protein [Candidatus Riflebacteria bacterium]
MRLNIQKLWLFFLLCALQIHAASATMPVKYFAPEQLRLSIEQSKEGENYILKGKIQCVFGKLFQLKVRFTSSPDLKITSDLKIPDEVASGETIIINGTVENLSEKSNNEPSWAKIHVLYSPDYDELIKTIMADNNSYPIQSLKEQLIKWLEKKKETQTQANYVAGIDVSL